MDPVTFAKLKALRDEVEGLRDNLASFTQRFDALLTEQAPKDAATGQPDEWKREDGRLNDQGIVAMGAMFAAGRTVTEIAKAFEITVSAASHRKRIWQAKPNAQA